MRTVEEWAQVLKPLFHNFVYSSANANGVLPLDVDVFWSRDESLLWSAFADYLEEHNRCRESSWLRENIDRVRPVAASLPQTIWTNRDRLRFHPRADRVRGRIPLCLIAPSLGCNPPVEVWAYHQDPDLLPGWLFDRLPQPANVGDLEWCYLFDSLELAWTVLVLALGGGEVPEENLHELTAGRTDR